MMSAGLMKLACGILSLSSSFCIAVSPSIMMRELLLGMRHSTAGFCFGDGRDCGVNGKVGRCRVGG